jgi:outer membrane protein assembly factor BamD (BamD/ComL family)
MKKIIVMILICASSLVTMHAQEKVEIAVTIDNLSMLYRNAQRAESAGDYESAVKIYKSILYIDSTQYSPYLKIANMYASNPNTLEAVDMAITMYEKYLLFAPKGSNRESVVAKTAELRQLMAEQKASGEWQQTPVNLTDWIQSNQAEMKDIVEAAAHPAMKATTKEEIVQAVEEVNDLWDNVQNAVNSSNDEEAIASLNKMLEKTPSSDPLYTQANILLAQVYGDKGDVRKMQEILAAVEENIEINENISQYLNTKIKDATPFEDDICGIWVSDLTYSKAAIPYIIMEISKDNHGGYMAVIKDCGLKDPAYNSYLQANGLIQMMLGHSSSKAQIDRKMSDTDISLFTSGKSVLSNNGIAFVFGDEKLPQKMSELGIILVTAGIDLMKDVGKGVSEGIIRKKKGSFKGRVDAAGVEAAVAGAQILIAYASIPVKITKYMDMKIKRLYPGYAELELTQIHVREKGNNMNHFEKNTKMRLAKLYPEYGISFVTSNKIEEYAKKNKQSYEELTKKISDYCWIKSNEDPNMKIAASECLTFFKYATQGLSYTKFTNANGHFEGWIDVSGKMQGFSKCVLNSGYEYIGEWKNNRYSGNGTLVYKEDGNVVSKYTGFFAKNKYEGKGLYQDGEITYEGYFVKGKFNGAGIMEKRNGDILSGTWKNGVFQEGKGTYKDGIFTGKWKFMKKENRYVPQGKGSFLNADSETLIGTWKNDIFIEYKTK